MKPRLAAVLALGTLAGSAPAHAQEYPTLYADYQAALKIFQAGSPDQTEFLTGYRRSVFDGIAGRWQVLNALEPESAELEGFTESCARNGTNIAVQDEYTLVFTGKAGESGEVKTTYTSRIGASFGFHTDANSFLDRIGIDAEMLERTPSLAISALPNANGVATIWRTAPDVFVLVTDHGVPRIFARCPEAE